MKRILTTLLLFGTLLMFADAQQCKPYNIPAGGGVQVERALNMYGSYELITNGAVSLSGPYTIQYDSLPPRCVDWYVYCDFSNLTTNGNAVTVFGRQPLIEWPGTKKFYLHFWVDGNYLNVPTLYYRYLSNTVSLNGYTDTLAITGTGDFRFKPTGAHPQTGDVLQAEDSSGNIGFGCVPWCDLGNGGLNHSNFLGTLVGDTENLQGKLNGQPAFNIDMNLANSTFGYQAFKSNTTGSANSAFGFQSLYNNSTGIANTAVGEVSGQSITTGSFNTAIGVASMSSTNTGSNNTSVGYSSGPQGTTGSYNTAIGVSATNYANTSYGIAIGYNCISYGSQCVIGGVRLLSIPGMASCVGCGLYDSTGNGDFKAGTGFGLTGTTLTPVTGDSTTITVSKNTVNPAGTIANWTAIMPANPTPYQVYEFSFQQTVTAFHISTRLSGGTFSAKIPTGTSAGVTSWGMYWNPTLSEWVLN